MQCAISRLSYVQRASTLHTIDWTEPQLTARLWELNQERFTLGSVWQRFFRPWLEGRRAAPPSRAELAGTLPSAIGSAHGFLALGAHRDPTPLMKGHNF